VKYSTKDLKKHLVDAKEVCAALGESFERNLGDVGISLCLASANEMVRNILRELRLVEHDASLESLNSGNEKLSHVEWLSNELVYQLNASKTAYAAICVKLESNVDNTALAFYLESMDNHIKDLVRELRYVDGKSAQEALVTDNENILYVENLSDVKTFLHLIGYYVTKKLKSIENIIEALKRDMCVLAVRGETKIPPEEELAVLEDAVLLGYWKVFHANANG